MHRERLRGLALEARGPSIGGIVVETALTPVLHVRLGLEALDVAQQLGALLDEPIAEGAELCGGERTALSDHKAADGSSADGSASRGG